MKRIALIIGIALAVGLAAPLLAQEIATTASSSATDITGAIGEVDAQALVTSAAQIGSATGAQLYIAIGGVIAAPFAAYATKSIPPKALMILVGCVVVILSLRGIIDALA